MHQLREIKVTLIYGEVPDEVFNKAFNRLYAEDPEFRREINTLMRITDNLNETIRLRPWLPEERWRSITRQFTDLMKQRRLGLLENFVKKLGTRLDWEKWRGERPHIIISGHIKGSPLRQVTQTECEDGPESLEALKGRAGQVKTEKACAEYRKGLAAKKPRDQRRAFCNALRLEGLAQSAPPPGNPKGRWKKPASEMLAR